MTTRIYYFFFDYYYRTGTCMSYDETCHVNELTRRTHLAIRAGPKRLEDDVLVDYHHPVTMRVNNKPDHKQHTSQK